MLYAILKYVKERNTTDFSNITKDEFEELLKGNIEIPLFEERYKNIELTYYNENGEKIVKKLNGFFARLVQHECDHLNGIVFLEKVKGSNGFATKENIEKYNLREVN